MTKKNYDEEVKEWLINKFSNRAITLSSFFKILQEGKVQMIYLGNTAPSTFQIFQVIEGDTLLVKSLNESYCILYPRHNAFFQLIFPFQDTYTKEFLK